MSRIVELTSSGTGEIRNKIPEMIKKLMESDLFRDLPHWMMAIEIPVGTISSSLAPLQCYKNLMAYQKENEHLGHPSGIIDNAIMKNNVIVTPYGVKLENSKGEVTQYDVTRGFLIDQKRTDPVSIMAAGFVSSLVSYYTRATSVGVTEAIPREKANYIKMKYIDLIDERIFLKNVDRSVTISRDRIYNAMINDPGTCLHMMCTILKKIPDFAEFHEELDKVLKNFYMAYKIPLENQARAHVPICGKIPVCLKLTLEQAWRILNASRQVRGEDASGAGTLTSGYYFFEMSRAIYKDISKLYDLMSVMTLLSVRIVVLQADLKDYVIKALVANGYAVISPMDYSLVAAGPTFEAGHYQSAKWDEYTLTYVSCKYLKPVVKKEKIEWPDIGVSQLLHLNNMKKNVKTYRMCYLHLIPSLANRNDVSLLPTTMPHNASVMVVNKVNVGVKFDDLVLRVGVANMYRNAYPYNRVSFHYIDA